MRLRDFTSSQIAYFEQQCNFTDEEHTYFKLHLKNCSNVQIALKMSISEAQVSKLAKRVKSKIARVM